jgi:peptide deformylase
MSVLPIRIWPDPALSTRAKPVDTFTAATRTLVADLFDTMYAESGIGLAANQVGVLQQVLVLDLDPSKQADKDEAVREELAEWLYTRPLALINPKIVSAEGEIVWDEGCLSVPGITDSVKRKEHIVVEALDAEGKPQRIEARGLFAVCIQHEMDHLAGKVFVEYLSKLKRDVIRRKMVRLKADNAELDDSSKAAGG